MENLDEDEPERAESKYVDVLPAMLLEEMKDAFKQIDLDDDGLIDRTETGKVWKKLGYSPTEAELEDMTRHMDPEATGKVSFFHFKKTFADFNIKYDFNEDDLRDVYRVLDKEGQGYVTIKELRRVTQILGEKLTEKELQEMMKEVDLDGDGRISYQEYKEYIQSTRRIFS